MEEYILDEMYSDCNTQAPNYGLFGGLCERSSCRELGEFVDFESSCLKPEDEEMEET